ncbi:unnamed protein product, partial [Rotaria magnacalcarata]
MNLIFCFGRVVKIKFVRAALVAALVYRKYAHENSDNGYRQK